MNSKADIRTVIFDLDGTLIDTYEHVVQAFEHVLSTAGVANQSRDVINTVLGKTLVDCYESLAPGADKHELAEQHHAYQQTPAMQELIAEYEGLRVCLGELGRRNILCAVATNRSRRSVNLMLPMLGLAEAFAVVVTFDDINTPKPDPACVAEIGRRLEVSAHDMVFVGDTPTDVLTGKNGNVRATVGITHGFGTREELQSAGADYIIDSLGELTGLIERLNDGEN